MEFSVINVQMTHCSTSPSFSSSASDAVQVLECYLASIMGRIRANTLKLNPDKMKILLLGGLSDWLEGYLSGLYEVTIPLKD